MSVITISKDFLESLEDNERSYLNDTIFVISQTTNNHKLARDEDGLIYDIYKSIKNNKEFIHTWLNLITNTQNCVERINVNISGIECTETKFIEICKETKGENKIVYYSKQNIGKFTFKKDYINYEGKTLEVLDKDEARRHFSSSTTIINASHSQIALNGSHITESNIKKNF